MARREAWGRSTNGAVGRRSGRGWAPPWRCGRRERGRVRRRDRWGARPRERREPRRHGVRRPRLVGGPAGTPCTSESDDKATAAGCRHSPSRWALAGDVNGDGLRRRRGRWDSYDERPIDARDGVALGLRPRPATQRTLAETGPPQPTPEACPGTAVGTVGDVNGDGFGDPPAGAPDPDVMPHARQGSHFAEEGTVTDSRAASSGLKTAESECGECLGSARRRPRRGRERRRLSEVLAGSPGGRPRADGTGEGRV